MTNIFSNIPTRQFIFLLKDTFPSSNVFVTRLIFPTNSKPNENISVPVDNHIETLKIEITTVSAESEFSLLYPNGMSSLNR